ncbi:MAG TPA: SDR family NAD(P)-dependent oxidoreductase [Mycobacteriales bacterium]|nr:SDR family NAD(P)-dependent oxidoreductase [Mycobacteriales bacterium]
MPKVMDRSILITGSNRGIGKALLEEALHRGAGRVYAGMRELRVHSDARVTPVLLDLTDATQTRDAVEQIGTLDMLINNAGIAQYDDLNDRAAIERHLAVNLFGTYDVSQAFLPLLEQSEGAIVNNLSVNALAPFPLIPAYSISKAAAFSMTQSLRTLAAERGVGVHAVLTGIVDTDMTRGVTMPKAAPDAVARAIFDGIEDDEEDIFPDSMSRSLAESWRTGAAKRLERDYAVAARVELARH